MCSPRMWFISTFFKEEDCFPFSFISGLFVHSRLTQLFSQPEQKTQRIQKSDFDLIDRLAHRTNDVAQRLTTLFPSCVPSLRVH